jgi:hypothetical protein
MCGRCRYDERLPAHDERSIHGLADSWGYVCSGGIAANPRRDAPRWHRRYRLRRGGGEPNGGRRGRMRGRGIRVPGGGRRSQGACRGGVDRPQAPEPGGEVAGGPKARAGPRTAGARRPKGGPGRGRQKPEGRKRGPNRGRQKPEGRKRGPNRGRQKPEGQKRGPNRGRQKPEGQKRGPNRGRQTAGTAADGKRWTVTGAATRSRPPGDRLSGRAGGQRPVLGHDGGRWPSLHHDGRQRPVTELADELLTDLPGMTAADRQRLGAHP